MPVVSLSMELGALNKEIAEGLIDELGGRSLYGDVVEGISRRTCMPLERIKGVIEDRPSFFDRWLVPYQSLSVYASAELLSIAARGNAVVRGWSAGHLFKAVSHIAIVRITAPLNRRLSNLARIFATDDRAYIRRLISASPAPN